MTCEHCLDWAIGFVIACFLWTVSIGIDIFQYRKLRDEKDKLQIENAILKSKEVETNDT